MSGNQEKAPGNADLEKAVRNRLAHRSIHRIRALEVEMTSDRIAIRGQVSSYHLKQLAIQAVLDETRSSATTQQVEIHVQLTVIPEPRS